MYGEYEESPHHYAVLYHGRSINRYQMNHIEFLDLSYSKTALHPFAKLFHDPTLSDLTITFSDADEPPLYLHRFILAARCSTMRTLFAERCQEDPTFNSWTFNGSALFFRELMYYLYCDHIRSTEPLLKQYREFIQFVREWCPEHTTRLIEERILTHVREPSIAAQQYREAYREMTAFRNVMLKVAEEEEIAVDQLVLVSQSIYFEALFRFKPDVSQVIQVNEMSGLTLKVVIEYMYSGVLNHDVSPNYVEMFQVASLWSLQSLKSELEYLLAYNLDEENVKSLLQLSEDLSAPYLKSMATQFLSSRSTM